MFDKILIANRGEIACRVIRTARRMGIRTVAVHADADARALHVRMADAAAAIGPAPVGQSYIAIDRVLSAVRESGAQAVHPGYGFLSERADFAEALEAERVAFIGPPAAAIRAMGDKIASKRLAAEAGVSTVPGFLGVIGDAAEAVRIAGEIGYPVMIKASAGGGGKGMRVAWNDAEAAEGFERSRSEAATSFGDDRVFVEKFVEGPRHIEIQVLGDRHGNVIHLGERDCSIQRRNQKVIEEAPSPFLDDATRAAMGAQAVALAQAVDYASAGTVEFIVDGSRNFYFLEMNTRLQVEHPVTELVTGVDLVEQMIRVAAGEKLAIAQDDVRLNGWAVESRIYAEDPYRNFLPSVGRLTRYRPPVEVAGEAREVRNDTGVFEGGEISIHYDTMIAKLCTWAPDRAAAIEGMRGALDGFELEGIGHNLPFLAAVMDHPRFNEGRLTTAFIAEEWPDGFAGVELSAAALADLAAFAIALHARHEMRAAKISGTLSNHERQVGAEWVVRCGERSWAGRIAAEGAWARVDLGDGGRRTVGIEPRDFWQPLVRSTVDGRDFVVKVDRVPGGYRLRHRGADLQVAVLSPRLAALAATLPAKAPPDTSKLLLCPMPGLVVKIDVAEGDEVFDGQALCMVEAMKMENVLRAERRARVAKVLARPGDSLAVDDVIMEFE
jgi:propionyl-CoA carboxylase alpha chain